MEISTSLNLLVTTEYSADSTLIIPRSYTVRHFIVRNQTECYIYWRCTMRVESRKRKRRNATGRFKITNDDYALQCMKYVKLQSR